MRDGPMRDNYAQRVQATQDAIRASVRAGKRLEDCMRRQKRPRVNVPLGPMHRAIRAGRAYERASG